MAFSRVPVSKKVIITAVAVPLVAISVFAFMLKDGDSKKPIASQQPQVEAAASAPQERKAFDVAKDRVEGQGAFSRTCPDEVKALYKSMGDLGGLTLDAFAEGYGAYKKAVAAGKIKCGKFILVDYTQTSDKNRFYLFDFSKNRLMGAIKVSHGIGNGFTERVDSVSSRKQSWATPAGLLKIRGVGRGKLEGWTLDGLKERNSNVFDRAILIHSWNTPNRISDTYSKPTSGCLGLNEGDALGLGLPLSGKEREIAVAGWLDCGIYVYFEQK